MPTGKWSRTDTARRVRLDQFDAAREEEFSVLESEAEREIKRETAVMARKSRDSVRTNRRSCVCNDPRCLEISAKYCIINDVRGTYMSLSSMIHNGGSSGGIFSDDDEEDSDAAKRNLV